MHPQVEKFEQLFSDGKQDTAALNTFFDELWLASDSLPRPEMRRIVDEVCEWVRLQDTLQPNYLALATFASGFTAFHEGNFETSLLKLAESRKLFTEANDEDGVYAVMVMEGTSYHTLGEMELALKHFHNAYQNLSQSNRYKIFQTICLYNLAEIYSETCHYDEALRYHQLCEKFILARDSENKNMLSRALIGIGVVYMHQKKYSLALDYLIRAFKLTEEINNLPVKARALTDLGSYYVEMGDYATAADYQRQALNIRNTMMIKS